MTLPARATLVITVTACVLWLAAACQDTGPSNATNEVTSGREPNASVTGSVTYRERIALTPDAKVVVELRDVSLLDAAAPLIARQTISEPGQVPIDYKVEYNRDDIDSNRTYSVTASIIESDGRLAFTNDTAREVITHGRPNKVDMVLVLVQPPPDLTTEGQDWRTWVENTAAGALGQPDTQRAGAPAADRLLSVHDRGLRSPREPGIGGGRQRHHCPPHADAAPADRVGNPLRRRGGGA